MVESHVLREKDALQVSVMHGSSGFCCFMKVGTGVVRDSSMCTISLYRYEGIVHIVAIDAMTTCPIVRVRERVCLPLRTQAGPSSLKRAESAAHDFQGVRVVRVLKPYLSCIKVGAGSSACVSTWSHKETCSMAGTLLPPLQHVIWTFSSG
eukprot:5007572-Amphidinium_carterae.3